MFFFHLRRRLPLPFTVTSFRFHPRRAWHILRVRFRFHPRRAWRITRVRFSFGFGQILFFPISSPVGLAYYTGSLLFRFFRTNFIFFRFQPRRVYIIYRFASLSFFGFFLLSSPAGLHYSVRFSFAAVIFCFLLIGSFLCTFASVTLSFYSSDPSFGLICFESLFLWSFLCFDKLWVSIHWLLPLVWFGLVWVSIHRILPLV